MSKHTPGPWVFYADTPSTDPNWHIVTTANRMRVLANVHIEPGNEMDLANARLIAAAPDLLDALQQYGIGFTDESAARAEFGDYEVDRELKRRAAISKAAGEQP